MVKKGAPEGNAYAEKARTGKTISLYLPADVLPAIAEAIKKKEGREVSETQCVKRAKEYALEGIQERLKPTSEQDQLRYLVSSWQALSNHAEVMAPELLDNPTWIALKAFSQQRSDELGMTAFTDQLAEKFRERIEREEEENEMITYLLSTSMAARANLDKKAARDGYEDACAHHPDAVIEGEDLKEYASQLVELAFDENGDLTDDPEEYRARYVDAYCKAYAQEIKERSEDSE